MNKYYLSDDKLKGLKKTLKEKLPNKTRATLIQIKLKTGKELYGNWCNTGDNIKMFWQFCNDELLNSNDPLASEFKIKLKAFNANEAGVILNQYIDQKYKNEWQTCNKFNATELRNFFFGITGFFKENLINTDENNYTNIIKELVECQDIDVYIDEKFSKKNIDKDLLQKTDELIKAIKIFYKDVEFNSNEYYKIRNATDTWLKNKDESELHNILNS